jgi:hypothetical protein
VDAVNAMNVWYTVTEGGYCDVDPNGTYIEAENYTGSISQGAAAFVEETSQAGYLGSGYLRSNGMADSQSCPATDEGKQYEVDFQTTGTYNIWIKGYATSTIGADDSVFVGIDGTCVGIMRETVSCSTNPEINCYPYLDTWVWTNRSNDGVPPVTIDVTWPGLHTINVWVREDGHLLDGIYITQGAETPTDASHGREIN